MIKATISNNKTSREAFAKSSATRIARGHCALKTNVRGLVLDNYKLIASGTCSLRQENKLKDNVILFTKQKEVA